MEDKIVTNIYLSKSYPKICEEPGKSIKKNLKLIQKMDREFP